MKKIRSLFFVILLGYFLSDCETASQPVVPTLLAESMKGYELYSWQENGQWKFAILVGTNREKTVGEIKSTDTVLLSMDALKSALGEISAGQYITWSSKEGLSFPSDDIIRQVEQICKDKDLILNIAK